MNIKIEFQGRKKHFHELSERLGAVLEFEPLGYIYEGQGYDKTSKVHWIKYYTKDGVDNVK